MRVLSLTRDAEPSGGSYPGFDCCWARPRMWEQYAERHRGVCLLFEPAALARASDAQWPRERVYMRAVDYTREGFVGSAARHLSDDLMFKGKTPAQVVENYLDTRRDNLLFLESDDFATERDRVVLTGGR